MTDSIGLNAEGAEPIAVSALQHVSYCPRQYALIHLEQVFEENLYTMRGQAAHQRVDQTNLRQERGVKVLRGLHLYSDSLGLVGRADVVEVLKDGMLFPVEYKLGKSRKHAHDDLQLAAQAMCLEEMMGKPVPAGAVYHVASNRRREVPIDEALRAAVREAIREIRRIQAMPSLPQPPADARCRHCSLIELCQPSLLKALNQSGDQALHTLFEPSRENPEL